MRTTSNSKQIKFPLGKRLGALALAAALSASLAFTGCATQTQEVRDEVVPMASSDATPSASAITLGDFTIWGVDGDTVTASDFAYDTTTKTITIKTDKHFAVQNTDQTKDTGNRAGYIKNQSGIGFEVPANQKAHMVFQGVGIKAAKPIYMDVTSELLLVLGDGTINELVGSNSNEAGIRCPGGTATTTGAKLTIDDSVLNIDDKGNHITPEMGLVPADLTLSNGTVLKKGDPLSKMESTNPGKLYVSKSAEYYGAGIGGRYTGLPDANSSRTKGEAAGSVTFDGGTVIVKNTDGTDHGYASSGAGIGGGGAGNGTGLKDWITINGGYVDSFASFHAAGIGAAHSGASGNIRINGGYVISRGGDHSNGFGSACWAQDSSMFSIVLTGGTLIPTGGSGSVGNVPFVDAGAPGLQVTITGSSLGNQLGAAGFRFNGIAKNDKGEPVQMIEVDLVSDVGTNNFTITDWQLYVNGDPYEYGAPAQLDRGHLYLWLPTTITSSKEVGVNFTYIDNSNPDNPQEKDLVMYRKPNQTGNKLKRYEVLVLEQAQGTTWKYYDGKGLSSISLDTYRTKAGQPLADKSDHVLNSMTGVTTACWPYDKVDGDPIPNADGQIVKSETVAGLPVDAGISKIVMTSPQYAETAGFKENYWGHQIIAWCEIKPTTSKVEISTAAWKGDPSFGLQSESTAALADVDDNETNTNDSDNAVVTKTPIGSLDLQATIKPGEKDPDEIAITDTSTYAAPRGYVELWVDGKAVSEKIKLVFSSDKDASGNAVTSTAVNAVASGCTTTYTGAFPLAVEDFGATNSNGKHTISLRYYPPNEEDPEPANYLTSASPTDDDEENPGGVAPIEEIEVELPKPPSTDLPEISHSKVGQPGIPDGNPLPVTNVEKDPTTGKMTGDANDSVTRLTREGEKQTADDVLKWLKEYYAIPDDASIVNPVIKDKDGNVITEIDAGNPAEYKVSFDVTDDDGNTVHVLLDYKIKEDPELKPTDPSKADLIETEPPKDLGDDKSRRTYEDRKAVTIEIDPDTQKDSITIDDVLKEAEDRYDIPADWEKTVTLVGPDGKEVREIDPNTPGVYTATIKYTTPFGNEVVVTQTYIVKEKGAGTQQDNKTPETPNNDNLSTDNSPDKTTSTLDGNTGNPGSKGWDNSGSKGFADNAQRFLAQTGDPVFLAGCGIAVVAVIAIVALVVARKKNKKQS